MPVLCSLHRAEQEEEGDDAEVDGMAVDRARGWVPEVEALEHGFEVADVGRVDALGRVVFVVEGLEESSEYGIDGARAPRGILLGSGSPRSVIPSATYPSASLTVSARTRQPLRPRRRYRSPKTRRMHSRDSRVSRCRVPRRSLLGSVTLPMLGYGLIPTTYVLLLH